MTCWTSCSISAALLLASCATARPQPPTRGTIAVLPPANLSGNAIPHEEIRALVEGALRDQRVSMIEPAELEPFLARHRVRNTAGVTRDLALFAAAELGVDAILVTTVDLYLPDAPPRIGFSMRLVSAGRNPEILWMDGESRAGDEAPGLFDLGVVDDPIALQKRILRRMAGSLRASRQGDPARGETCGGNGRFSPRSEFRSPLYNPKGPASIAVLPFVNDTRRRGAGDLLALQLARQLHATGKFRVVEPGVVREELLRYRIVMETGVTLDGARVVAALMRADLVLSGVVRDFLDRGVPQVSFTANLLDQRDSEVVWMSSSYGKGDDGVFFFDAGLVGTAPELGCRMARAAVQRLVSRPRVQPLRKALR